MRMLELIIILIATYFTVKSLKNVKADTYHLPDENPKEEVEQDIMVCITEEIAGQIYVWNKETNEFITQAKEIDHIVNYFKEKYPNKKVILTRSTYEEDGIQTNG